MGIRGYSIFHSDDAVDVRYQKAPAHASEEEFACHRDSRLAAVAVSKGVLVPLTARGLYLAAHFITNHPGIGQRVDPPDLALKLIPASLKIKKGICECALVSGFSRHGEAHPQGPSKHHRRNCSSKTSQDVPPCEIGDGATI